MIGDENGCSASFALGDEIKEPSYPVVKMAFSALDDIELQEEQNKHLTIAQATACFESFDYAEGA